MFDFEEAEIDIKDVTDSATQEKLLQNESYTNFYISFMEAKFKQIKLVKAFGIETFVGNVGGYVGLFLGLSIIEIPKLVMLLYRKLLGQNKTNKDTENNVPTTDEHDKKCVTKKQFLEAISELNGKVHSLEEKLDRVVLRC